MVVPNARGRVGEARLSGGQSHISNRNFLEGCTFDLQHLHHSLSFFHLSKKDELFQN